MKTFSEKQAFNLANLVGKAQYQNDNLSTAINALKAISHGMPTFTNDQGISTDDRKKISDFLDFLESRMINTTSIIHNALNQPENKE